MTGFAGSAARRSLLSARALTLSLLERGLGVQTRGDVSREELGYRSGGIYRASSWLVLHELFRGLEVADDDVFVDVGSGMGRVLYMAARRPFKRVVGVERSERLNRIARTNIDRNRRRLACRDVEIATVDALEWAVPDDVTVVYFFCPFPDDLFDRLVGRLLASIDRRPRSLRLIYNYSTARDREVVMSTGRARRVSLRVPRYARSRFEEVSMFLLLPANGGRRRHETARSNAA